MPTEEYTSENMANSPLMASLQEACSMQCRETWIFLPGAAWPAAHFLMQVGCDFQTPLLISCSGCLADVTAICSPRGTSQFETFDVCSLVFKPLRFSCCFNFQNGKPPYLACQACFPQAKRRAEAARERRHRISFRAGFASILL